MGPPVGVSTVRGSAANRNGLSVCGRRMRVWAPPSCASAHLGKQGTRFRVCKDVVHSFPTANASEGGRGAWGGAARPEPLAEILVWIRGQRLRDARTAAGRRLVDVTSGIMHAATLSRLETHGRKAIPLAVAVALVQRLGIPIRAQISPDIWPRAVVDQAVVFLEQSRVAELLRSLRLRDLVVAPIPAATNVEAQVLTALSAGIISSRTPCLSVRLTSFTSAWCSRIFLSGIRLCSAWCRRSSPEDGFCVRKWTTFPRLQCPHQTSPAERSTRRSRTLLNA